MPAPVYAILGDADRDESQEAINLNIVDSSGKHVDLGGGQAEPGDSSITAAKLAASAVETATDAHMGRRYLRDGVQPIQA